MTAFIMFAFRIMAIAFAAIWISMLGELIRNGALELNGERASIWLTLAVFAIVLFIALAFELAGHRA